MKYLIFFLFLLVGCTPATVQVNLDIPNFKPVIVGKMYRGGQPTTNGFFLLRKDYHVDCIIKLNEKSEGDDRFAEQIGMKICYCPISLPMQLASTRRVQDEVSQALYTINSCLHTNGVVYVHCEHGQDRTGLVIGEYRYIMQHWHKDFAYEEMLTNGFHPILHGLHETWEKLK